MTTFFRDGSPLFYGLCGGAAEPMGVVTKLRRRPSWNLCQLVRATRLRHQTSNLGEGRGDIRFKDNTVLKNGTWPFPPWLLAIHG